MNKKKWYKRFWDAGIGFLATLIFLLVFRYYLISMIWFTAAMVNVYRGVKLRSQDI